MRRLSTAYAYVGNLFLVTKWHTTACNCCVLFDFVLTGLVSTPHSTDKARLCLCDCLELIVIVCIVYMALQGMPLPSRACHSALSQSTSASFSFTSSGETTIFSLVSRRTITHWFFSISFGPISIRVEIP